jgi:hypothetical protein
MLFNLNLLSFCFIITLGSFNFAGAEVFFGNTRLNSNTYEQLTLNGPSDLQDIKTKSLTANGSLRFQNLEVTNEAIFNGSVSGENGIFDRLTIHGALEGRHIIIKTLEAWGPVSLTDSKIEGNVKIIGPLSATKSHLNDITVAGSSSLEDVSVNNIFFNKKSNKKTLTLSGNTVVSGNITFESGQGEVIVSGDNVKIQGKIKGGELKK